MDKSTPISLLSSALLRLVFVLVFGLSPGMGGNVALAQQVPQTGRYYYAIENLDRNVIELRGQAGSEGIAFPADLILAPNTPYRAWILQANTREVGFAEFTTPDSGRRVEVPTIFIWPDTSEDTDGDQLRDDAELILGTDPNRPDTDNDGIPDGAEVHADGNPLDGFVASTGMIATTRTPAAAVDVWAGNDLVVTAEGLSGVSILNAYHGANPTILAHVPIPGSAQRVAGTGNFVAVAAGPAGLVILDVTTPAEARLQNQVPLAVAQAVVADAGTVYVGTDSGMIAAVDLVTGTVKNQISVQNSVWDLALAGDFLYAVTDSRLLAISLVEGAFELASSSTAPFGAGPYRRLFVGGGIAYATHRAGYHTFDLADPAHPVLLALRNTAQLGWRQIVANGSGLGVAAVGSNVGDDGPHDVSLYDVSDPRTNDVFLATFVTPGLARAVTIDNGLAYVADDTAGLGVINYLPYDGKGLPPTIALATSFPTNAAVEMAPVWVTANSSDDVQVRNVEFYLDGEKVFSDRNFPFEYRFTLPGLGPTRSNLVLRARAFDTGGNAAWSDELMIVLVPDTTAPRVRKSEPIGGAKRLSNLQVYFNELMEPVTLNPQSFQLVSAGADGVLGTADDVPVSGGAVSYRADARAASLNFESPLSDGLYRALLTTNVTDLAGNRLGAAYTWQFRVANAVFWSKGKDGFWNDPSNWSSGAVPGPGENVVIDVASADLTITHAGGSNVVQSLIASERMKLTEGTLQILGASQFNQELTLTGGTLKGATIAPNETARIIFTGHPGNTFDGVSVQGDLNLPPASRVRISNGLKLAGAVSVDSGAVLEFDGDQILDTGSIVFTGNTGFLVVDANTTLTLGPTIVLRGKSGNLGGSGGASRLVNRGLISSDAAGATMFIALPLENSGRIEAKNGGSLSIIPASWNNAGQIEAGVGGTLTLGGAWANTGTISATDATVNLGGTFSLANLGVFNRAAGTVNLTGTLDLDAGTMTLNAVTGPWTVSGGGVKNGIVTQSGSKLSFNGHPANTLDHVNVQGDLELGPGSRVQILNGLTLAGTALVDGGVISFAGDQTFNTGGILFTGTTGFLDVEANTTLTLGPAVVLRGKTGAIRLSGGNGRLINQGLISSDVAGATMFLSGGQFENTGAMEGKGGGSLSIQAANWINSGRIDAVGSGAVTLEGAWENHGTINADGTTVNFGGTFTLANVGTFNRTGGTVNLTGVLELEGGTLKLNAITGPWRSLSGTVRNGTVVQSEGAKLAFHFNSSKMSTFENVHVQGDLDLSDGGQLVIRSGLTLQGSVLLDNSGAITFAGDQTFDGASVVFVGNSGFLGIESSSTLTLGPTMTVRGKGGTIGQGGLLGGSGKLINLGMITADVADGKLVIHPTQFENSGTLAATAANATLTVQVNPFSNTGTIQEQNGGKVLINP